MCLRCAILLGLASFSFNFASHAQWQFQQLCTFSNNPAPPRTPSFITQGTNGNFYGTLIYSSVAPPNTPVSDCRFFEMTPSGGVTLFPPATSPPILSLNPELATADDGAFYATTTTNASFPFPGLGLILKLTPSGQISTAFAFRNPSDGGRPSSIRRGLDGFFYGVTSGTNTVAFPPAYYKTIFQFATNNTLTTLYSVTNAIEFTGAPVQGPDGFLYGTTALEIFQSPSGSTYRVSFYRLSTNGDFTTLYTRSNSAGKAGELIFGSDGLLYGAIGAGSASGFTGPKPGSIFRITTTGDFTNLFTFNGTNGFDPVDRLLLAADGSFYGTTDGGIAVYSNSGTLFHLSTNGGLTTVITFTGPNEIAPTSPMVQASDGNLYGTAGVVPTTTSGMVFRLVQPTAAALSISNDIEVITWNSFTNGIYRLEYKSNLDDPAWMSLDPTVIATASTSTVIDHPTDPHRFYRLVLLP